MKEINSINKNNPTLKRWDVEWWQKLENSWKIILLSNYCFNYDKYNEWSIDDCNIECPAMDANQSNEDYLISFALWVGGDLVGGTVTSFEEHLNNIPQETLDFIVNNTRFLWCTGITVSSLKPLLNILNVKEVQGLCLAPNCNLIPEISKRFNIVDFDDKNRNLNLKNSLQS